MSCDDRHPLNVTRDRTRSYTATNGRQAHNEWSCHARGGVAITLLALLALLVSASSAGALAVTPLTITRFTVQATARTVETEVQENGVSGLEFVNEPYSPAFSQAGGHPWALTTAAEFERELTPGGHPVPTRDAKDIVVDIPPGLVGNPMALPRCPLAFLISPGERCPSDTQLGYYVIRVKGGGRVLGPLVNVTPEAGQSAEFGLENEVKGVDTPLLTAHLVRTANPVTKRHEYTLTVVSKDITAIGLLGFEVTFWGVPADPTHNPLRGRFCQVVREGEPLDCLEGFQPSGLPRVPFLSMSTSCSSGPETATMRADSWEEPGEVREGKYTEQYKEASVLMPAVTGCGALQFKPGTGVGVEPDTELADQPVGLGVKLNVPLSEEAAATATPSLRETRVTLPEGMSVSPGVVDGIRACDATGAEGINIEGRESEEEGADGELHLAPGHCPDASIVGTAEAITPFLPVPVKGHVYLARPGCGGAGQAACTEQDALDGNLYKLYLELGGTGAFANTGIELKTPLDTQANPATGQLTTVARDLPQLPYSEVIIHLNGGPRAPIDNPAACGQATTTADFTPWSAPGLTPEGALVAGIPDLLSSSSFTVAGCPAVTPFSPGFSAGTVTPQAGQFSAFTMQLSRQDREQFVKGVQIHTPPGLLAMLSSVPLCPEAQANNPGVYGECTASKIGTTRVASGAGSHPFEIEGNVYLTGPHNGAPFGLSVVTHAVAGPFNLGLVVVRARIDIDPTDSTATITTDETGPYALPQIVFGVPLRLKRITVNIDRPGFMFNPTSCNGQQVTANISGSQDATAVVSSPFAVGGCKSLAFKPKFTVSTSGHTSRAKGASLDVKLSYPAGSVGNEANIARVKVDLPKQLPSRLTTLQKACTAAQFALNPGGCPAASIVGIAKASTPLLPVGLSGPVYFVSHGGEAFPSLIVVLQGDGVRVDLTGSTFISKAGITNSTFKTVPDVPVGTFELYLPEGKFSALAANGSLCKSKLVMPSEFVGQNGAVMKQSTKIAVTGCPKAKAKQAKQKRRARKARVAHHRNGRAGR
jgi:hypothetical protein